MPRFRGEAKRPRIRRATASVWMRVAAILPCAVMAVAPNGAGAEDLPFTGTFQVIGLFPPFSMPGSGVASGTPLSFVLPPSPGVVAER